MVLPTIVSLYAGAGIGEVASKKWFNTIMAVDHCPVALEAFKKNHPDVSLMQADLNYKGGLQRLGLHPDGLIITAPCPGYSPAGAKLGDRDPRSILYQRIPEDVQIFRPRFCIIENSIEVLRRHDAGYRLMSALQMQGYHVAGWDIDAADYGCPSHRRRAFIVASKSRLPSKPEPTGKITTVKQAIGHLTQMQAMAWGCMRFSKKRQIEAAEIKVGKLGANCIGKRQSWDQPANTITTNPNHTVNYTIHPSQDRPWSVVECLCLMGLHPGQWSPDAGHSMIDNYRHIGNGVAYHAMDVVCKAIVSSVR